MSMGEGVTPVLAVAGVAAISEAVTTSGPLAASAGRSDASAPDSASLNAGSTRVTMSALAQQLASVLSSPTAAMPYVQASQPLMTTPVSDARQLAAALQHGLESSGLFYESHLLEWHQGRRELSTLSAEPQASRAIPDTDALIHDEALLTLVRSQLDTLDTGRFRWEGELCPGMALRWQLHKAQGADSDAAEGAAHHGGEHGGPEAVWMSTLQLNLPMLGELRAQLSLQDHTLRIRLVTPDRQTVHLLDERRPALAAGLGSAGIQLDAFSVHRDDAD